MAANGMASSMASIWRKKNAAAAKQQSGVSARHRLSNSSEIAKRIASSGAGSGSVAAYQRGAENQASGENESSAENVMKAKNQRMKISEKRRNQRAKIMAKYHGSQHQWRRHRNAAARKNGIAALAWRISGSQRMAKESMAAKGNGGMAALEIKRHVVASAASIIGHQLASKASANGWRKAAASKREKRNGNNGENQWRKSAAAGIWRNGNNVAAGGNEIGGGGGSSMA